VVHYKQSVYRFQLQILKQWILWGILAYDSGVQWGCIGTNITNNIVEDQNFGCCWMSQNDERCVFCVTLVILVWGIYHEVQWKKDVHRCSKYHINRCNEMIPKLLKQVFLNKLSSKNFSKYLGSTVRQQLIHTYVCIYIYGTPHWNSQSVATSKTSVLGGYHVYIHIYIYVLIYLYIYIIYLLIYESCKYLP